MTEFSVTEAAEGFVSRLLATADERNLRPRALASLSFMASDPSIDPAARKVYADAAFADCIEEQVR